MYSSSYEPLSEQKKAGAQFFNGQNNSTEGVAIANDRPEGVAQRKMAAMAQTSSPLQASMASPDQPIQMATQINEHDLTEENVAFSNSFYNYHWAESEEDAQEYSLIRMDEGFRGQNNTVIEGSLDDIAGYIVDADIEMDGEEDDYVTFTIQVSHWYVVMLVGADENLVESSEKYDSDVTFKGYLKKDGDDVKKILVTGISG